MERITYRYNLLVKPEDISIGNAAEEERIREELQNGNLDELKEIAKAAESLDRKLELGSELTATEEKAFELYYGNDKPQLQLNPNGKVEVSDGKHRMMAMKLANVSLYLDVLATAYLQPVRIEKQKGKDGKTEETYTILPEDRERKYLLIEQAEYGAAPTKDEKQALVKLYTNRDDKVYLLISQNELKDGKEILDSLYRMQAEHQKIYGTRNDIFKGGKGL